MLVLHAAWIPAGATEATDRPAETPQPAHLALWAETNEPRRARRPQPAGSVPLHPFAVNPRAALEDLALPGLLPAEAHRLARLPGREGRPIPSRAFFAAPQNGASRTRLGKWLVPALIYGPLDALSLLANLPAATTEAPGLDLAADVHFWNAAARFALELLAGQRFMPALEEPAPGAGWRAVWRPAYVGPDDPQRLAHLAQAMPPSARALATGPGAPEYGPQTLLEDFLNVTIDAFARDYADVSGTRSVKISARKARAAAARLSPGERWLAALISEDPAVNLPAEFLEQYRQWSQPAQIDRAGFRLCFRLEPPAADPDSRLLVPSVRARDWTLQYMLQANDDPSLLVPAGIVWRERSSTLNYLKRRFEHPQEALLAGLGRAARVFPAIEDSLRQARPEATTLTADEAHAFIRESALLLQAAGFGVLLPGLNARLGVRLKLGGRQSTKSADGGVSRLGFDNVVAFDWQLALGDQALTREEFERLARLKVPLVQIRGQWVELRPEQLQQALDFLEKHEAAGELAMDEAMRLALGADSVGGLPVAAVEAEGWFGDLLGRLSGQDRLQPLPEPPGFEGQLRPYQSTGYAWLAFLRQFGLGGCLADDMGLGKTIQTIALLLHQRANGHASPKPALLVCPTSVVANWQREVARFAPGLRVLVHHGQARQKDSFARLAYKHDLVVTSYALLPRDEELLTGVEWAEVILDEAQNIKNPDTRQARSARKLQAEQRLALTGTPVENRLAELWSLFHFLNPGYLGSQEAFRANFARPIERAQDPDAARRLKALTSPFILRRVKTDPAVINDLPLKNEMKVYCSLTREQATLYEAVVRDSLRQIAEAEGMQRRGLVLATLLRLKQVCNHPAQYLSETGDLAGRSGKLNRLVEMLEEARALHERVLIFTQFSEMGGLLQRHLQSAFSDEVLFLHGDTPARKRSRMIDRFQDDPHGPFAFVLSLKAGGTGLNLTRASHVFHFDRWWNPAVENQATDRAFRIGQTRNVQVYKFVCSGTVEERIDEMIEDKLKLADAVVGTSEAWVTELSTDELRDIFALRESAAADW
jgi:SNF2 family DNA or RNA helicase